MENKWRIGIKAAGLVIIVGGVVALMFNYNFLSRIPTSVGEVYTSLRIVAIICQVLLVFSLVYGMGILWFQEWARMTAILISIIVLIIYPLLILGFSIPAAYVNKAAFTISMGFPIALIYFFTRPKVKEHFK